MWVWYCRPPIGAHFHPTPQPPPVPQQLGEKAHLRIAWSVAALRRPPLDWIQKGYGLGGRTRLVQYTLISNYNVNCDFRFREVLLGNHKSYLDVAKIYQVVI